MTNADACVLSAIYMWLSADGTAAQQATFQLRTVQESKIPSEDSILC